jgi:hypothetical protein
MNGIFIVGVHIPYFGNPAVRGDKSNGKGDEGVFHPKGKLLIAFKNKEHTFTVGKTFPVHQPLVAFLIRAGNFDLNPHIARPGPLNGKRYGFEPLGHTGGQIDINCEKNKKEGY